MIKVHHLNNSRSQRVLWLLEDLGESYDIVRYERDPVTNLAPPSLKKVHPLGKSPVIEDDGLVLAESGAIIEYLARKYGKGRLIPAEQSPDFVRHLHWMHFAEGSAMLPFILKLYAGRLGEASAPIVPRIDSQIEEHLVYLESALAADYLLGSAIMAVDYQMVFIPEVANVVGKLDKYPKLKAYMKRLHERPGFKRALERGGPYRYA